MGPLFSFLTLAVIGSIALAATFVVSLAIWPWKSAAIVAFVAVPAGFAGAGLALVAQAPFWPHTLLGVQPAIYLGIGATVGLVSAILGVWLVVRLLRIAPR